MNQFVVNRMAKNIYRSNCHYGGIDCMLTTFYVPSHHKNFIHLSTSTSTSTPKFILRPRPGAGAGGLGFTSDPYDPTLYNPDPPKDGSGGLGITTSPELNDPTLYNHDPPK
jgi:hypothetical protein